MSESYFDKTVREALEEEREAARIGAIRQKAQADKQERDMARLKRHLAHKDKRKANRIKDRYRGSNVMSIITSSMGGASVI